jgi:hypothetical protein
VQKRFLIAPPDVMAAHADWTTKAAEFPGVAVPPPLTGTTPAAAVIAGMYAQVAEGHAQFGTRLAATAEHVQQACFTFVAVDEENAGRLQSVQP